MAIAWEGLTTAWTFTAGVGPHWGFGAEPKLSLTLADQGFGLERIFLLGLDAGYAWYLDRGVSSPFTPGCEPAMARASAVG